MRIIAVSWLRSFWGEYPEAKPALRSWVDEVKKAAWRESADIKAQYRSAGVRTNRRVVFNIKRIDYRLLVSLAYRYQGVYVELIGTHAHNDAVDAETVSMDDLDGNSPDPLRSWRQSHFARGVSVFR